MIGVEAVIDKTAASALLATDIGADTLLSLTQLKAVGSGAPPPDKPDDTGPGTRAPCRRGRWCQRWTWPVILPMMRVSRALVVWPMPCQVFAARLEPLCRGKGEPVK